MKYQTASCWRLTRGAFPRSAHRGVLRYSLAVLAICAVGCSERPVRFITTTSALQKVKIIDVAALLPEGLTHYGEVVPLERLGDGLHVVLTSANGKSLSLSTDVMVRRYRLVRSGANELHLMTKPSFLHTRNQVSSCPDLKHRFPLFGSIRAIEFYDRVPPMSPNLSPNVSPTPSCLPAPELSASVPAYSRHRMA